MAKVCFLIPASPNDAFFSQVAAFSAALGRLRWTGWEPSVLVCLGGDIDTAALARWRPFLDKVDLCFVAPAVVAAHDCWYGQIDSLYRFAPRDADVLVRMDADTLPVGDLEDVLDFVVADRCVAGVMAHFPFPRSPGLSARQAWQAAAAGLIDEPLDFRLAYSLVDHRSPAADRDAPFYVNDGAVFLPRAVFDDFATHYLALRPRVMGRLAVPYYAGQVALTLAVTQARLRTCALPIRYNFPNDPIAAQRFPEELENARIFHFLRTEGIDRQTVFDRPEAYARAVSGAYDGADGVLGGHIARLLGRGYPFAPPALGAPPAGHAVATSPPAGPKAPQVAAETLRVIREAGVFDASHYLATYPDVRAAGVDPLAHYVAHGENEGRSPSAAFDPVAYRRLVMEPAGRTGNALRDHVETGGTPAPGSAPAAPAAPAPPPRPATAAASTADPLQALAGEFARTGVLEPLLRYKRALVAAFGAERAAATYAGSGLVRDSGRVRALPLVPQREHLLAAGSDYFEWHAGGEPFAIPAPRCTGPFPTRPLAFVSRPLYLGALADALVRGRSSLVVTADRAVLDYERSEAALFDVELDIDPGVFAREGETAWVALPAQAGEAMDVEEAYSLLGPQTGAFGDWMYQTLPRYVAADASGRLPPVPVLVDEQLPASVMDSLQRMLRPGVGIIRVPAFRAVRVRRLWCSATLHYAPAREVMDARYRFDYNAPAPDGFLPVVREMARRVGDTGPSPFGERVYLARKASTWRTLVNREEIEAIARARGFAIVHPEDLDFAGQVAMIRGARRVVAPEGSAVLLAYFARPGLRLCILNHPVTETTNYDGLLDGVELDVVTGPFVEADPRFALRSSYTIDPAVFRDFLDRWSP